MTNSASPIAPASLLTQDHAQFEASRHLGGFGGFHGGLALGILTRRMQSEVPDLPLRSATGRFHRPLEGTFGVSASLVRAGRTTTVLSARLVAEGDGGDAGEHVEGSAIFGDERPLEAPAFAPAMPDAPPPEECEVFALPAEFVPITAYLQIRPVGPNRPYAGGDEPELTAWIRMTDDDDPPDAHRFVFLMDALAPSYAAVLSAPIFVPTVEITVKPAAGLAEARSPWILLRARTHACTDGWVDEHIDAWDEAGSYLGSAHQLRILRSQT
jgi:hypothetical protein